MCLCTMLSPIELVAASGSIPNPVASGRRPLARSLIEAQETDEAQETASERTQRRRREKEEEEEKKRKAEFDRRGNKQLPNGNGPFAGTFYPFFDKSIGKALSRTIKTDAGQTVTVRASNDDGTRTVDFGKKGEWEHPDEDHRGVADEDKRKGEMIVELQLTNFRIGHKPCAHVTPTGGPTPTADADETSNPKPGCIGVVCWNVR